MLILISILGNLVAGGKIDLFFGGGCWVLLNSEFQGKWLKMPMFPTPSIQPGELLKHMYAFFLSFVFQRIHNKVLIRKLFS